MKKLNYFVKTILSSLLILTFLVIAKEPVSAEEGTQIQTKGEITLFDESPSSSSESTSFSSTSPASSSEVLAKTKGRLPSTGELIKYSFLISGLLLMLLLLLYWINHRKKGKEQ